MDAMLNVNTHACETNKRLDINRLEYTDMHKSSGPSTNDFFEQAEILIMSDNSGFDKTKKSMAKKGNGKKR